MAQRPWNSILEHIRSLAGRRDSPACDAELLLQFVSHNDESAFEALLRRHGPMVLRVARRIVGNDTDAEDVFQATFLLLARRAGSIRKRESAASWLHGVAHRLALTARGKRTRRQRCEREAAAARSIESPESAWSELEETLHEVLAQLPAKYRTPLVYCYLEGWTQEEVARQLGKPLGTVRGWLARGRELLRKRLQNRGIFLSGEGASAVLLASVCATAEAVPMSLRMAALQAAHSIAIGGNAMTLISPAVAALVKKGLTAMMIAKLKSGAACVLALGLLVAGTGWVAHRTFPAKLPEANQTAEKAVPMPAASEKLPLTDAPGDPLPPGAVARLGTIRFRHEGAHLWQFAVSPDGRALGTAAGRSLILWDMATGRTLHRFPLDQSIRCLAFAPDGKSVALGGEDCIVHRIDAASGKELQRFAGHLVGKDPYHPNRGILGVAFACDGKRLISWGSDKIVRVWETQNGKELRQLGSKDFGSKDWYIEGLAPDGKLLAVRKGNLQEIPLDWWNLETGKELGQRTYPNALGVVAFSPNGKILAVCEANVIQPGRIVLRDVESGKELAASLSKKGWVDAGAFSPDGKTLATAGFGVSMFDPSIHFWDVGTMKEIRGTSRIPGPHSSISQLAFSTDGKTLISRCGENHVRLWDVASGKERNLGEGSSEAIYDLAWSPNAKLVASTSVDRIWLWSAATGKAVRILKSPENSNFSALAFSADGKLLISAVLDNANKGSALCVWDVETGKERRRIPCERLLVKCMAVAPDGETIAVWGVNVPQTLFLWNARTGEKLRDIGIPSERDRGIAFLKALQFSPDGKVLFAVSGTHSRILRWDVASGKELPFIGKHLWVINGFSLSPDGRSVAVVMGGDRTTMPAGATIWDGTLCLWETATGQERLIVKDVGFSTSVAFSPDGNLLALVNAGNHGFIDYTLKTLVPQGVENREQVRLLRVEDGKVIRRFTGHLGGIGCLSFSPDGRTLASGGHDSTVLVWDVSGLAASDGKEAPPLKSEKLAELWKGLRGKAADAHGCMWKLISAPSQTVSFLGEKLKPAAALDAEKFARLLEKLESDQFSEREKATQELQKLGYSAESALCKALQEKRPLETRRRLQALVDSLDGTERLRFLRAIEVLERINDKPVRDLLRRLSEGAAGAWLTIEARATLQRCQSRAATVRER